MNRWEDKREWKRGPYHILKSGRAYLASLNDYRDGVRYGLGEHRTLLSAKRACAKHEREKDAQEALEASYDQAPGWAAG